LNSTRLRSLQTKAPIADTGIGDVLTAREYVLQHFTAGCAFLLVLPPHTIWSGHRRLYQRHGAFQAHAERPRVKKLLA
jgi:hypothetical protein